MKVSVIIPAWNAARTLVRAVESVQRQTYPDWELLLVDNRSTDETPALMRQLVAADATGRTRFLSEARPGASHARNLGLANATGTWMQFLDADDELLPHKFAHQLTHLPPGPEWIISGYRVDDPTGLLGDVPPHPDPWRGLVHGFRIGYTSSNLYHRRALERIGGWDVF